MSLPRHSQALFETTRRVLAELINEGLVNASVEVGHLGDQDALCLQAGPRSVRVGVKAGTIIEMRDGHVISVVRPDSLQPPVCVDSLGEELDPGTLFEYLSPGFSHIAGETTLDGMVHELRNSAANQEKWLEIGQKQRVLTLLDKPVEWERTLIYGHPTHPYHRLCYAQPPLSPVVPDNIPSMLEPTLAFISVPRKDMRITGDFEKVLQPLLDALKIQCPVDATDRVIVPCLAQQLPSIRQRFPAAVVLKLVTDCADAQASIRTITIRQHLNFGYHLKLSLACQITSALRTITPWTTSGGPVHTELLEKFLPRDLWVFREIASVSGGQDDFNEARHFSCVLRDSLEMRAIENDENLIIAAALAQKPHGIDRPYAEILYSLETVSQKKEWFETYLIQLFQLVLPPLVQYGIGLEAHGQNLVARVCRQTGRIKGFCVRDFGGVRMHRPTLRKHGVLTLDELPPGAATLTDNLDNVWSKVHHSLIQNHVGFVLSAFGLERYSGWEVVRGALSKVLVPEKDPQGKKLYEYFTRDTMPFKCFLRMRMENKYRDYIEREVPNTLLMDSARWGSVLDSYQPSLHAT